MATAAEDRLNISPTNPMPSRKFVVDPGHWRFRAEEARTVADQMTHEEARTIMRRIAMDYDLAIKLRTEWPGPIANSMVFWPRCIFWTTAEV